MKTLLLARALILLGIVAPFIPSANGERKGNECYKCGLHISERPNDPCWNNNPPAEKIRCEGRCYTKIDWKETHGMDEVTITRDCTDEVVNPLTGCYTGIITTHCSCEGNLCNNEPLGQIPKNREGNRDAQGSTGEPGGDGPEGALAALVGPSFGTLVMGLLLGVGEALLPLLFQ